MTAIRNIVASATTLDYGNHLNQQIKTRLQSYGNGNPNRWAQFDASRQLNIGTRSTSVIQSPGLGPLPATTLLAEYAPLHQQRVAHFAKETQKFGQQANQTAAQLQQLKTAQFAQNTDKPDMRWMSENHLGEALANQTKAYLHAANQLQNARVDLTIANAHQAKLEDKFGNIESLRYAHSKPASEMSPGDYQKALEHYQAQLAGVKNSLKSDDFDSAIDSVRDQFTQPELTPSQPYWDSLANTLSQEVDTRSHAYLKFDWLNTLLSEANVLKNEAGRSNAKTD